MKNIKKIACFSLLLAQSIEPGNSCSKEPKESGQQKKLKARKVAQHSSPYVIDEVSREMNQPQPEVDTKRHVRTLQEHDFFHHTNPELLAALISPTSVIDQARFVSFVRDVNARHDRIVPQDAQSVQKSLQWIVWCLHTIEHHKITTRAMRACWEYNIGALVFHAGLDLENVDGNPLMEELRDAVNQINANIAEHQCLYRHDPVDAITQWLDKVQAPQKKSQMPTAHPLAPVSTEE
ncbi:MAG TPA: hypothetical protein VGE32_10655 [Cellvibrio sp.]